MEGGCGANRRLTLLDHMTNSPVVEAEKQPTVALGPTPAQVNKTLLDIIREEGRNGGSLFGHKDKKSWKVFRDRLRLKRAGAAWTSLVHIPASDIPVENNSFNDNMFGNSFSNSNSRSFMSRHNSMRFNQVSSAREAESEGGNDGAAISGSRPQITRRISTRFGTLDDSSADIHAVGEGPPEQSFMPQLTRRSSVRFSSDSGGEGISLGAAVAEERTMSAREAVSAQEAAEAERDADGEEDDEEEEGGGEGDAAEPVMRMSLMDLLEETDRQLGVVGSSYKVEEYEDAVEEEDEGEGSGDVGGGLERTCCVCMVRHKGAAFIPCGHTFCRMCSRDLLVQRGNCPLCNGYILEILDIF